MIDASAIPTTNVGQNDRPVRLDNANGMKNGSPSGTSTSVSRASCVIVVISPSLVHVMMNARMLTNGSVNNNAPNRGNRPAISATVTMTVAEMTTLSRFQIMRCKLFVRVRFFFEITRVRRVFNDTRDGAGVFLDHAQTLVVTDEA